MANVDEVAKLKVPQLKELAAEHGVELASDDNKEAIVIKVSDGITPEQLEAYNAKVSGDESGDEGGATPPAGTGEAPVTGGDNAAGSAAPGEQPTPPVAAGGNSEETHESNAQVQPGVNTTEARNAELEEGAAKEEARKEGAKAVDTELGSSEEEGAAKRANVGEENLENPKQNREPKNQAEQENQKVTEQERQAAQKASEVEDREKNSPTPNETAHQDAAQSAATNGGDALADAINSLAKSGNKDNFELQPEEGVEPRFSLVRNKQTKEVLLRDNGDGTLSQIQLKSIEEKENDLQGTEVEEL